MVSIFKFKDASKIVTEEKNGVHKTKMNLGDILEFGFSYQIPYFLYIEYYYNDQNWLHGDDVILRANGRVYSLRNKTLAIKSVQTNTGRDNLGDFTSVKFFLTTNDTKATVAYEILYYDYQMFVRYRQVSNI